MFVDDGLHIIPTAVAYFHVVLVEDLMEFVILREVYVYELLESSADVSLYILAVWWVVPDYVALSVSSFSCG